MTREMSNNARTNRNNVRQPGHCQQLPVFPALLLETNLVLKLLLLLETPHLVAMRHTPVACHQVSWLRTLIIRLLIVQNAKILQMLAARQIRFDLDSRILPNLWPGLKLDPHLRCYHRQ
jgi:hypothetical protein